MARINECKNYLIDAKCNQWIIDNYKPTEDPAGNDSSVDELDKKADEICSECKNFAKKDSPKYFSGTQELFRKGKLITSKKEE